MHTEEMLTLENKCVSMARKFYDFYLIILNGNFFDLKVIFYTKQVKKKSLFNF